jgi:hypothetical protein
MAGFSETMSEITLIWDAEPYSPLPLYVIELKSSLCSSCGRNRVAGMPFKQYMIGDTRRVECCQKRSGGFNVLAF